MVTWLVFGHQPSVNEPAPLIGEIAIDVLDKPKGSSATFPMAWAMAQAEYGDRLGHIGRKSHCEYIPGRGTITTFE